MSSLTLDTWKLRSINITLILVILIAPSVLGNFYTRLVMFVGISALVAVGLIMLASVAGLISFGQAAFMGLGAYATAYITVYEGGSPWLGLVVGLLLTAFAATILGLLSLRLSGPFLPVGTIAWGIALNSLLGNLSVLGGQNGIIGVPEINFLGYQVQAGVSGYYLVWTILVLATFGARNLLNSRVGRGIRALRTNGVMAEAFGIDTVQLRLIVFIYAALLAAIAGWLYAHLLNFVNPTPFSVDQGLEFLFMAVIGGAGSPWGAVLGAGVITFINQGLQDLLPSWLGNTSSLQTILLGVLLILLLQRLSSGLTPRLIRYIPKGAGLRIGSNIVRLPPLGRPSTGTALLEVRKATKQFGGLLAVNGISFEMRHGEVLGLIGPNGAGKSTCFDLISGVQRCSSGEVLYKGKRIDRIGSRAIAALGVSRTFQHVKLIHSMTVLENVAIGATLRGRRGFISSMLRLDSGEEHQLLGEAQSQLEELGLGAHIFDLAGSLPLGKQRLVEIARALCAAPELLLLDEPAAGLREQEKDELASVLERLRNKGLGIILVEHNLDFLMRLADRLVVMQFGKKLASGTPNEVTRLPEVIDAYLGSVV